MYKKLTIVVYVRQAELSRLSRVSSFPGQTAAEAGVFLTEVEECCVIFVTLDGG
jgi:hypothetical protein